jgi:hypothetical protein
MTAMTCAQLHDIAPDLALGLVTGHERANAIEHLDTCHRCRSEVASLAETADELLLLAPEAEPAPGFEAEVLARLGHVTPLRSAPTGRQRPAPRWLAIAAAVAVVVAAAATLWTAAARDGEETPAALTAEMRTGTGERVGTARLQGAPASLVLDLPGWADLVRRYDASPDADYHVVVEHQDGSRELVALPEGSDERWELPLDTPADEVASVAILDGQGRAWCSARFT